MLAFKILGSWHRNKDNFKEVYSQLNKFNKINILIRQNFDALIDQHVSCTMKGVLICVVGSYFIFWSSSCMSAIEWFWTTREILLDHGRQQS